MSNCWCLTVCTVEFQFDFDETKLCAIEDGPAVRYEKLLHCNVIDNSTDSGLIWIRCVRMMYMYVVGSTYMVYAWVHRYCFLLILIF